MIDLERYSEPFPPTGAIDASATKRALGKPKAEFWDVLFKEAIQNSWDARIGPRIAFDADIHSFNAAQRNILRQNVFCDSSGPTNAGLRALLNKDESTVLILQDRHTRGLGGPTNASAALREGVRSDFRNFIFDIGRDSRRKLGGGTYGFGKGVLYAASSISTCLVYSQFRGSGGDLKYRFIVSSVSEQHEEFGRRFTGRQWWGKVEVEDGIRRVEPIEGSEARWLAEQLGLALPVGVTGTSIGIVSPRESASTTDDESKSEIAKALVAAVKKWAWPHLVEFEDPPTIDFSVIVDGRPIRVSLDGDKEYEPFGEAYRAILARRKYEDRDPPFTLSVHRTPSEATSVQTGWLALKNIYVSGVKPKLNNRVALMRGPGFVVDYKPVKAAEHGFPRVGVFVADSDDEIEQLFAKSEPVTHDKWAREPGRSKFRPIAWTLDAIDELTGAGSKLDSPNSSGEGTVGIAKVSRLLGTSLIGLSGAGAELSRSKSDPAPHKRGGGGMRGPRALVEGSPRFVAQERDLVIVEFRVTVVSGKDYRSDGSEYVVRPNIRVKTEAGQDASVESAEVEVRGWFSKGVKIGGDSETLSLRKLEDTSDLWVRIAHRDDVAALVRIGVDTKEEVAE